VKPQAVQDRFFTLTPAQDTSTQALVTSVDGWGWAADASASTASSTAKNHVATSRAGRRLILWQGREAKAASIGISSTFTQGNESTLIFGNPTLAYFYCAPYILSPRGL
jgi:hypothetical protein